MGLRDGLAAISAQLTSKDFYEDRLKEIMIAPSYQEAPGNLLGVLPTLCSLIFPTPENKLRPKDVQKPDQVQLKKWKHFLGCDCAIQMHFVVYNDFMA